MARRDQREPDASRPPLPPPATTLEGREEQLIAAAMNLAERRIDEGTASAQEVVHFLRLGSVKNQLEQDKLRQENNLLLSRITELESRRGSEELMQRALNAFRGYAGMDDVDPEEEAHDEGHPDVF